MLSNRPTVAYDVNVVSMFLAYPRQIQWKIYHDKSKHIYVKLYLIRNLIHFNEAYKVMIYR